MERFLQRFVDRLRDRAGGNLRSVVLFGSRVRGTARPDSDIDLLIVFTDLPKSYFERNAQIKEVLNDVRSEFEWPLVSTVLLTTEELKSHPRVMLDMVYDSRTVLDDGTFEREIGVLKRRMDEFGTRRVSLDDGTWYWILKPGLKPRETVVL